MLYEPHDTANNRHFPRESFEIRRAGSRRFDFYPGNRLSQNSADLSFKRVDVTGRTEKLQRLFGKRYVHGGEKARIKRSVSAIVKT